MLNVVMLSVYAECSYTDCRYAECLYAECSYTECHYVNVLMLSVVAPLFATTALNLMTYSIMTLSINVSFTTFSICEINITKFDPRMSMFKLSRWLYHEKFMFCFYSMWGQYVCICHNHNYFLQPEQVAYTSNILQSSYDDHHERKTPVL
jgi:hypothetical protein